MYGFTVVTLSSVLATLLASSSALPGTTTDSLKSDAVAACPDSDIGKLKCLAGGTYFVMCTGSNSTPQQVSPGTQCVNGTIVRASSATTLPDGSLSAVSLAGLASSLASSATVQALVTSGMSPSNTGSVASSIAASGSSAASSFASGQSTTGAMPSSTKSAITSSGLSASSTSANGMAVVAAATPVPNGATFDCKANNVTTRYLHCLSPSTYVLCGTGAVPVFIVPIGSSCDTTKDQFSSSSSSSSSIKPASSSSSSAVVPAPIAATSAVPNGAYFNCRSNGVSMNSLHCIDQNTYVQCADAASPVLIVPIGSTCDTSADQIISSISTSSSSVSSSANSAASSASSSSSSPSVTTTAITTSVSSVTSTTSTSLQFAAISILNSLLSKFGSQTSPSPTGISSSMSMTASSSAMSSSAK